MCTVADSKKKKNEFFIRPVNKIIKILAHLSSLSVSLSVTLSSPQSLSHLSLSSKLLFHRRLPHVASRLTPPIACSSSRRSEAHRSRRSEAHRSRRYEAHRNRRSAAHRSRRSEAHRSSPIASRYRSPHLTPSVACSSSRRSETHGARRRAACL